MPRRMAWIRSWQNCAAKLRPVAAESSGTSGQERDLVQLLEDVDRGLDELDGQVGASEEALDEAEKRVSNTNENLRVLESRMVETRRVMSQRAVALYKAGTEGPLRLLFASEDLREMFSKLWSLERILQADAALLEKFRAQWLELENMHNRATQARTALALAQSQLSLRRTALTAEKGERRVLLEQVRTDRTRERALLQGLERAAVALEETLAGLEGGRSTSDSASVPDRVFLSRKGELRRPVQGRIRNPFGRVVDEQYRTQIFRKGVEFQPGWASGCGPWLRVACVLPAGFVAMGKS